MVPEVVECQASQLGYVTLTELNQLIEEDVLIHPIESVHQVATQGGLKEQ